MPTAARLVATLATTLHDYARLERLREATPQEMQQRTWFALQHLQDMCRLHMALRAKHTLSTEARLLARGIKKRAIMQALSCIVRVTLRLTPRDYEAHAELIAPTTFTIDTLAAAMSKAFIDYGPSDYSQEARDYAIASILLACGFEQGNSPATVVARLRKRAQRAATRRQN